MPLAVRSAPLSGPVPTPERSESRVICRVVAWDATLSRFGNLALTSVRNPGVLSLVIGRIIGSARRLPREQVEPVNVDGWARVPTLWPGTSRGAPEKSARRPTVKVAEI